VPASVKVLIQWIILYLFQDMKGKLMCHTQQLGLQLRLCTGASLNVQTLHDNSWTGPYNKVTYTIHVLDN